MARTTVAEQLREHIDTLTKSERQLSDIILQNYPVTGLGTITSLATAAEVSTPTVARLVQKLGFTGFGEFQQALRRELDETISSPLTKREKWVDDAPDEHILNRFTKAVIDNIGQSLGEVDPVDFDQACDLISDLKARLRRRWPYYPYVGRLFFSPPAGHSRAGHARYVQLQRVATLSARRETGRRYSRI